jgi:hypothetical protein
MRSWREVEPVPGFEWTLWPVLYLTLGYMVVVREKGDMVGEVVKFGLGLAFSWDPGSLNSQMFCVVSGMIWAR